MFMDPFKFTENRVWRVYTGGKQIDQLRGKDFPEDNLFPEDWIASTVQANNPQHAFPNEGLSTAFIDGEKISFKELIRKHPEEMLGVEHISKHGISPGFLTKLLDSAIRLPLQVHPDRETAKRLYDSDYGKTEAWIVLGTREINTEKPYLILGFNDNLDKGIFLKESLNGDMPESFNMVHKHEVKAGDVLMLSGGLVHAIGPGVFMIEIMEPTDFVTQPELFCEEQVLSTADRFGDISPEKALEVFHYTSESKQATWEKCAVESKILEEDNAHQLSILLDRNQIGFFGAEKLKLNKTWEFNNIDSICRVGIVCKGNISVITGKKTLDLKKGDTFFIPACTEEASFAGQGEIIFALPPV